MLRCKRTPTRYRGQATTTRISDKTVLIVHSTFSFYFSKSSAEPLADDLVQLKGWCVPVLCFKKSWHVLMPCSYAKDVGQETLFLQVRKVDENTCWDASSVHHVMTEQHTEFMTYGVRTSMNLSSIPTVGQLMIPMHLQSETFQSVFSKISTRYCIVL